MKLVDLEPEWLNYTGDGTHRRFSDTHAHVTYDVGEEHLMPPASAEDITHADGILFLCPTCFKKNGGSVGTESVLCWFAGRNVPPDLVPGPGRWAASGTGFNDLTLNPSINVDHEHWHGWIRNGEIT